MAAADHVLEQIELVSDRRSMASVARCSCGWRSRSMPNAALAHSAFDAHTSGPLGSEKR